jgi:RNA polymerase sigma-70 factor, ECF subfamily
MHSTTLEERATDSASVAQLDRESVRRFVAGDESAFVDIMTRHRGKVFAVAFLMLKNRADAEEIAQDTFIRAHRGLANFRNDSSLATWLHRIALNLSRNRYWYFFRRKRHVSLSLDCQLSADNDATFADIIVSDAPSPAAELAVSEFSAIVAECMEELPDQHREILTLRNIMHRSYIEIAATLRVNVGTVKSRIARARGNLEDALRKKCPSLREGALVDWLNAREPTHASSFR